jgi:hypothetical protein
MLKNSLERGLHWWPALWPPLNEDCLSRFYMSVLHLFLTYLLFGFSTFSGSRLFESGVLALYFAQIPLYVCVSEDLTRAEKWQSLVQQTIVAFIVTAPLINVFRNNWM